LQAQGWHGGKRGGGVRAEAFKPTIVQHQLAVTLILLSSYTRIVPGLARQWHDPSPQQA